MLTFGFKVSIKLIGAIVEINGLTNQKFWEK